jgi:hypothetical protein
MVGSKDIELPVTISDKTDIAADPEISLAVYQ